MKSIKDVIREVLENPKNEVDHVAYSLGRALVEVLEAAGIPTGEPSGLGDGTAPARIRGTATLHLETPLREGEGHGVFDLKMDANVWLDPVYEEAPIPPGSGVWAWRPNVLLRYDVFIEGFTVPMDDTGTHLTIREAGS